MRIKSEFWKCVNPRLVGVKLSYRYKGLNRYEICPYDDQNNGCFLVFEKFIEDWDDNEKWNWDQKKWVSISPTATESYIVAQKINNSYSPSYKPHTHNTNLSATNEAKRLADLNKGKEFAVLKEIESHKVELPKYKVGDQFKVVKPFGNLLCGSYITVTVTYKHKTKPVYDVQGVNVNRMIYTVFGAEQYQLDNQEIVADEIPF